MSAPAQHRSDDSHVITDVALRHTRVLIVSDHPAESRSVATNLRKLGLDVQLSLFDGKRLNAMPKRAPDAVLCHLTDYAERGPHLARVVRAHFAPHDLPIIGAMSRPTEDERGHFDSTVFSPIHPSQIANRVNAMIRLGVMEGEIMRRLETLRDDFGQTPEISKVLVDRRFRVLFIGKASPSFMIVINALQDKGVDVVAAFTSFSAFDYLHGEPFDAVIMNAMEQSEPAFSISEAMRRNSKLYHTPTLFLVDKETFKDHDAAYERGARDIISNDSDPIEISGRILELANYHRIHEQMKADFFALTADSARDDSGTAFSREFMQAHLPRVMADAAKSNAPVTLIGLKLTSNSTAPVSAEALSAAINEAAGLISNLVRMQDVVCRWDEDRFVLAFFNTEVAAADIVLERIKGLIDLCA